MGWGVLGYSSTQCGDVLGTGTSRFGRGVGVPVLHCKLVKIECPFVKIEVVDLALLEKKTALHGNMCIAITCIKYLSYEGFIF